MSETISLVFETFKTCAIEIDTLLKNPSTDYLASQNSSGDMQLKVDVQADKLIEQKLLAIESIKGVCSEEKQEAVYKVDSNARLLVAYDPLDGSSLVDSNLSIGTIFGIYDEVLESRALVASGYIVYGPRLEIVLAHKQVEHWRYCAGAWHALGILQLKSKGKINAPGGTQQHWTPRHKALIDSFFAQGYRLRYSGGMVPDLHQILIKGGGLFSYPATQDAPEGKLRKLFEVFPFAFVYECAGGEAIDGTKRLLELDVKHIHDSTPCFFGSSEEIARVRDTYNALEGHTRI